MVECSIEDCTNPARSRGWCSSHWNRWKRYGDPEHYPLPTAEERFWAKVDKAGDCWIWTANTVGGYGYFSLDGKSRRAHRVAYEWLVGPIPEGLVIDHLCRTPNCVNPDHMEPVTPAENTRRSPLPTARHSRKTHCLRGHPLTPDNVYIIPTTGSRQCRQCSAMHKRAHKLRRRNGSSY